MACGGLDADNIRNVLRETQVDELHFAAPRMKASGMMFRNPGVGMGGAPLEREYQIVTTDAGAVRRTIAAARAG
jgi:copper homeostasis protein